MHQESLTHIKPIDNLLCTNSDKRKEARSANLDEKYKELWHVLQFVQKTSFTFFCVIRKTTALCKQG